jgi:hypothetical protein
MKFQEYYLKEDEELLAKYDELLKSFPTISALLHSDEWDRMAFGYTPYEVVEIPTKALKVKYPQDYSIAKDEIDSGIYKYKDAWEDLPPIEVSIEEGLPYIDDGYHRYYYAKKNKIPAIKSLITIKSNPFAKLGISNVDDLINRWKFLTGNER